jgi:protein involved in polysaccharide export with SLBB domain
MTKLGKINLGMAGMARQSFAIASVCRTALQSGGLLSGALLVVGVPSVAAAQTAVPQGGVAPTAPTLPPFTAAGASADYRVGVGDVLGISVYRSPEMASQVAVGTDGTIVFPELGPIHVSDRTTAQIATEIQTRLRRAGILTSPQVNVIVVQLRARLVSVMGAVSRPGEYPVDRESMTVSQVLALAGANFGTGDAVVTLIEGNGVGAARSQVRIADIVSGSADRATGLCHRRSRPSRLVCARAGDDDRPGDRRGGGRYAARVDPSPACHAQGRRRRAARTGRPPSRHSCAAQRRDHGEDARVLIGQSGSRWRDAIPDGVF